MEDYALIVKKLRAACPSIQFSSDFIVGYPGETDKDFQDTVRLIEDVGFAQSFSFKFSPRPGTPSAESEEQIDSNISSERLEILQKILNSHQSDFNKSCEGQVIPILSLIHI